MFLYFPDLDVKRNTTVANMNILNDECQFLTQFSDSLFIGQLLKVDTLVSENDIIYIIGQFIAAPSTVFSGLALSGLIPTLNS